MNKYIYVTYLGAKYTISVDNGLSWRDCPFFSVFRDKKEVARGIGGRESAERAIKALHLQAKQ